MQDYKIIMQIEAPGKKDAEAWIDHIAEHSGKHKVDVWEAEVKAEDEPHYEERIRYVEDWNGEGEHFLFEGHWTNEEWGLDAAFKLFDYKEEKGALIAYQALTKIRELMRLGIEFHFGK